MTGLGQHFAGGTCWKVRSIAARNLWFADRPIREECLIVDGGRLAGTASYTASGESSPGSAGK
jgi:hypothetical protein